MSCRQLNIQKNLKYSCTLSQLIKKFQNLMILVFCSSTLICAAECRKYTLRGQNFKIILGEDAPGTPLQACAFSPRKAHLWGVLFVPCLRFRFFCLTAVLKFLLETLGLTSGIIRVKRMGMIRVLHMMQ